MRAGGEEHPFGVGNQLLDPERGKGKSEVVGGDLLEQMGFVEDHTVVVGQDPSIGVLPQDEVREEEVMVHDDDLGAGGTALQPRQETVLVAFAPRSGAGISPRVDRPPEGGLVRQSRDLGPVPCFGLPRPGPHRRERPFILEVAEERLLLEFSEAAQAEVVVPPLHRRGADAQPQLVSDERDVAVDDLVLKSLRARRNDDPQP